MSKVKMFDYLQIPLNEIRLCTNDFSKENHIRRTGYGNEYRGELSHLEGRSPVIVNRFDENSSGMGEREFLTQIVMLAGRKHENIISLVGYCDEGDERIVVYKDEKHGYLDGYIGSANLTWMQRIQISVGIARGLNYLHCGVGSHHRVLHRDIKSSNILLDENWMPRITGFEISKIGPANQQATFLVTNACGTFGYLDPFYYKTGILTKEADAYSFGVVLFEILCGRAAYAEDGILGHTPFLGPLASRHYEENRLDELIDPILRKQMDLNSLVTFSDIAYQCLKEDRQQRPRIGLILKTLEKALEFQQIYENPAVQGLKVGEVLIEGKVPAGNSYKVKYLDHLKIPFEEMKSATGDFDGHCRIGGGGFGTVYRAVLFHYDIKNSVRASTGEFYDYKRTQSTVAIKRLDPKSLQGNSEFLQEISVLCNYRHQNVVSLVGFCDEGNENILVYEHATNGSLDRYFRRGTGNTIHLTWARRLQICIDVAKGIDYLHNGVGEHHRIIHRDLKSSNILLDRNWRAKVSDFGLARVGPANLHATFVMTEVAGTMGYLDPQYWKTRRLTKASDVYSFGVVLCEVLCGRLSEPPRGENEEVFVPDLVKRCIQKKSIHMVIDPSLKKELEESATHMSTGSLPESVEIFANIAYKCLHKKQEDRPTIAEVIIELVKAKKCDVKGVEALRISLEEIKVATNNFSDENVIGEGGFGKLYRGELSHSKGHSVVAIKRLKNRTGSYVEGELFEEISKLFRYNHKNIITLLGFCEKDGERIIVYEHAVHGSLDRHLNNSNLTWGQRLKICIGIANGLDHIHNGVESVNTIHGDIKSSNILLDCDWEAAITDFIISKGAGTLGYLDPRYITTGMLTKESDVYSFGVILLEILSGRMAIVETSDDGPRFLTQVAAQCFKDNKLEEIIYGDIKEQVEASSFNTFAAITYQCLRENPEERPKNATVVKELEKAYKLQDEWEWEQKLPRDYEKIIQKSKSRMSSRLTRKELHSILSSGILLKHNVWFSLSNSGANNMMISAKKFEFKNLKTLKWRSVKRSRFPKVARISDASNLNVHIKVSTQLLSPGIIYGAYLVFDFCDRRKVFDGPLYVNLKCKSPSETLKACVAIKEKDEKWMMVELCKFMHHDHTLDFEMLIKRFSSCSYGSDAIFIEGISFEVDNPTLEETHTNNLMEL